MNQLSIIPNVLLASSFYAHTHTHTGTCSDLQLWTSTVNLQFQEFYMQPWTCTLQSFHGWTWTFCVYMYMCVNFNYVSNHGLPPTHTLEVHHWMCMSVYMHAYAICYRMAGLWQKWTSTVGVCPRLYSNFSDVVHGWRCLQTHAHTHTHTQHNTIQHSQRYMQDTYIQH